jgi:DNA polymerase-3 subunit delta
MDCRSFTEQVRQSLEQYLARGSSSDCALIVLAPKLEKRQLESKWYTAMEPAICHITVWPLDAQSLPTWVKARASHLGIKLEHEAITYLCERSQHNTLATQQELEKLSLSFQGQTITLADLENTIAQSSRYEVYELADAVLLGHVQAAHRILNCLDAQKVERFSVLIALTYTLKQLLQLHELIPTIPHAQAFKKCGIWTKKEPLYQAALRRLSHKRTEDLLMEASECERVLKGLRQETAPNDYLERWMDRCCGAITPTAVLS